MNLLTCSYTFLQPHFFSLGLYSKSFRVDPYLALLFDFLSLEILILIFLLDSFISKYSKEELVALNKHLTLVQKGMKY